MKEDIARGFLGAVLGLVIGVTGFFLFWGGFISNVLHTGLPSWSEEWYLYLFGIALPLVVGIELFFHDVNWFESILQMIVTSIAVNIMSFVVGILVSLAMIIFVSADAFFATIITFLIVGLFEGVPSVFIIVAMFNR